MGSVTSPRALPPAESMARSGVTAAVPDLVESAVSKVKHGDGTKTINGYRVRHELGSGSFGKVKLCEEEGTSLQFAMKVFKKSKLRRQRDFVGGSDGTGMKIRSSLDKVYNEAAVMRRVSHQNCIRLRAIFDDVDRDGKLYFVIEYAARGCAMDWDNDRGSYYVPGTVDLISEAKARAYVFDVLSGLAYLHSERIAHRDVKPQNLLVTQDDVIKICDFGVAIEMGEDHVVVGTEGTYHFFSPEMCRSGYEGHDGRSADVWAAGITTWAFLFGEVPFMTEDLMKLLEAIAEARYEIPAEISPEGRSFLQNALAPECVDRPLCPELLMSAWCSRVAGSADELESSADDFRSI